ncbi:MAG: LuxR C-terminal-related transcriptional regulator [Methylotetracoccus sp.]|nr:LuxR C-terminal-related transcriptional regulator [Methylotetracoccus sp.]
MLLPAGGEGGGDEIQWRSTRFARSIGRPARRGFSLAGKEYLIIVYPADKPGEENSAAGAACWDRRCVASRGGLQNCAIVQRAKSDAADPTAMLSARELQIAALVASGSPNKQIAAQLQLSEWTVATYLRQGGRSRAAMTFKCAALIELEQRNQSSRRLS